jgi:hypothetical protein
MDDDEFYRRPFNPEAGDAAAISHPDALKRALFRSEVTGIRQVVRQIQSNHFSIWIIQDAG